MPQVGGSLGISGSAKAFEIRDFFSQSVVTYDWIELDELSAKGILGINGLNDLQQPVCEFPEGTRLFNATVKHIANRLEWVSKPRLVEYDVFIHGARPAGLSAAVYAVAHMRPLTPNATASLRNRCCDAQKRFSAESAVRPSAGKI
jgi:hypothetical protein